MLRQGKGAGGDEADAAEGRHKHRDGHGADGRQMHFPLRRRIVVIGAVIVVMTNYKEIHEVNIFALVLVVQSLPFLAAVAIAALEGSRFNEFAYWRRVEAKVAETLPRPAPVAAEAPAQLPADKRVEAQ